MIRNPEHIEILRREYPAPHRFASVDVSDDSQVSSWAVHILNTVGVPDLLINNAALVNTNAPLWEIQACEFDGLTSVNINGVANVIRHFVPAMVKINRGVIVNFSSGWGRGTSANVAPYCATKWAIEGLTKALAQELPQGMAAVPLNPGIIDTDMLHISFGNEAGAYEPPEQWAARAIRKILTFGPKDSGKSLSVD